MYYVVQAQYHLAGAFPSLCFSKSIWNLFNELLREFVVSSAPHLPGIILITNWKLPRLHNSDTNWSTSGLGRWINHQQKGWKVYQKRQILLKSEWFPFFLFKLTQYDFHHINFCGKMRSFVSCSRLYCIFCYRWQIKLYNNLSMRRNTSCTVRIKNCSSCYNQ